MPPCASVCHGNPRGDYYDSKRGRHVEPVPGEVYCVRGSGVSVTQPIETMACYINEPHACTDWPQCVAREDTTTAATTTTPALAANITATTGKTTAVATASPAPPGGCVFASVPGLEFRFRMNSNADSLVITINLRCTATITLQYPGLGNGKYTRTTVYEDLGAGEHTITFEENGNGGFFYLGRGLAYEGVVHMTVNTSTTTARYTPPPYRVQAVQLNPNGDQLDVVWPPARTPHGGASYIVRACGEPTK